MTTPPRACPGVADRGPSSTVIGKYPSCRAQLTRKKDSNRLKLEDLQAWDKLEAERVASWLPAEATTCSMSCSTVWPRLSAALTTLESRIRPTRLVPLIFQRLWMAVDGRIKVVGEAAIEGYHRAMFFREARDSESRRRGASAAIRSTTAAAASFSISISSPGRPGLAARRSRVRPRLPRCGLRP